jgi:hypothetical protein
MSEFQFPKYFLEFFEKVFFWVFCEKKYFCEHNYFFSKTFVSISFFWKNGTGKKARKFWKIGVGVFLSTKVILFLIFG